MEYHEEGSGPAFRCSRLFIRWIGDDTDIFEGPASSGKFREVSIPRLFIDAVSPRNLSSGTIADELRREEHAKEVVLD